MVVVFRMPFSPVTKTTHGFSACGRAAAEVAAPSQFPPCNTRSKIWRKAASSGPGRMPAMALEAASVLSHSLWVSWAAVAKTLRRAAQSMARVLESVKFCIDLIAVSSSASLNGFLLVAALMVASMIACTSSGYDMSLANAAPLVEAMATTAVPYPPPWTSTGNRARVVKPTKYDTPNTTANTQEQMIAKIPNPNSWVRGMELGRGNPEVAHSVGQGGLLADPIFANG
mmetsp:Transcript_14373/g.25581  ORF Transcript_14373/g.25581 Transcript_14373/m.25581 type:complete len:228 (-) Transcript_14373:215-898(-)